MKEFNWTGLNDINGKPIFEGDILDDKNGLKGKVFLKDGSFRLTSTHIDINNENFYDVMSFDLIRENALFVIGNICENPELLNH